MRTRAFAAAGLIAGGVGLGVLAEIATAEGDPGIWVPDLVVGWVCIGSGAAVLLRAAPTAPALLLAATGAAWFLPDLAVGAGPVSRLLAHLLYLHLAVLVHLLVGFPDGRLRSWGGRAAVAVGYGSALLLAWSIDAVVVPVAVAVVALTALGLRGVRGPARRAGAVGLAALTALAAVQAGGAVARLLLPGDGVLPLTRWATEAALCAVVIMVSAALIAARWQRSDITDLVVDLGADRADALRDGFARALGDPGLRIAYRVPDDDGWVDSAGRAVTLGAPRRGLALTTVEGAAGPVAVLEHHPAVLRDPGLRAGVQAAAVLAAANAGLQAAVRASVAELAASRRRLLDAGDDQRRVLERRLRQGVRPALAGLDAEVAAAGVGEAEALRIELAAVLGDLDRLSRGLHPHELDELGASAAIRAMAARSPLPVHVEDPGVEPLPPAAAAAAYYVCSEALANAAKHAEASSVRIRLSRSAEALTVGVADDGRGGADAAGSGLLGLADRLDALGGRLRVDSPGGGGTRLVAEVPLTAQETRVNGKLP